MTIRYKLVAKVPARATILGIPVTTEQMEAAADGEPKPSSTESDLDWDYLASCGFEGKVDDVQSMPGGPGALVAIGVGPAKSVDARVLRRAGAALARAAKRHKHLATTLVDVVPKRLGTEDAVQAIVEGIGLGAYRFGRYQTTGEPDSLVQASIVASGKVATAGLEAGRAIVAGAIAARDLVNEPGGVLTPSELARRTRTLCRAAGVAVTVHDERAIAEKGLGGLLGVNRGSTNPARLVELTYSPTTRNAPTVALVGKGITFDSGGLSIKTGAGMMSMKTDMGGAAAVIGAMKAIGEIQPEVKVRGFLPMTDNMLGGDATRPGDVLTIRNGKTIEVLNTDAEGRLVLADALSLASEEKPDAIVDLATLTGACMVALGPKIAGVMGTSERLIRQLKSAADRSGERIWELPLPEDYRSQIDSTVADMKNIGTPHGGAITAALLLKEFVEEGIPWAHLDIAGPSNSTEADGEVAIGGTGFGVRLLVDLVRHFTPPS